MDTCLKARRKLRVEKNVEVTFLCLIDHCFSEDNCAESVLLILSKVDSCLFLLSIKLVGLISHNFPQKK